MFKSKKFLFIIGLAMILSSMAYARVCFLGGGNDFDGDGEPDDNCLSGFVASVSNCPGYSTCQTPKKGADTCVDGGTKFYLPEECCSNSSIYETCDTSAGYVCPGIKCVGTASDGEDYTACELGKCECDAKYKESCNGNGQVGVGISCNGKYAECKCDPNKFHKCGANATGSDDNKCIDSSGTTYYGTCTCPSDGNWTPDLNNCCAGAQDTCTNSSGTTYYECKDNPSATDFGCVCGTTKQSNGCINGCSDSSYSYKGSADRVTCSESYPFINGQTGICGNNCHCSPGYYEYSDLCYQQESDVCDALGYTDVTCPDEWLACPFNSSKKKCFSNNCFDYEGFCTDQSANFCNTLGYSDTSCSGDFIGCPLNNNLKKCLNGTTNEENVEEEEEL